MAALLAAKRHISPGNRVLILGGSGGVGTFLIQLAKQYDASFIATTSTGGQLLTSLGADRVIDYRKESWWDIPEFEGNSSSFFRKKNFY